MKKILIIAISIMVITSCSGLKVLSDMDTSADFTKYKTIEYYGWKENSDKIMNQFDKDRIEKAFDSEFKSRGYDFVEADGDLVVALHIVAEEKTQTTATTDHYGGYGYGGYYGYGPGWGWGGTHSTTTINEYDYVVGTLVCSVYDKQNEKLIWEGIGIKEISENPQKREKNIPITVKQIMEKYPVTPVNN